MRHSTRAMYGAHESPNAADSSEPYEDSLYIQVAIEDEFQFPLVA